MSRGLRNEESAELASLVAHARTAPLSPGPWVASLCLHVVAVALLAGVDWGTRARPAGVEQIEDLLARDDHKLVWHTFEEKLPPVEPSEEKQKTAENSRAEFKAPQTIIANDPDPRSNRQMIWTPEPAPEIEYDVPSPNLLVWTPPEVPRLRFEMEQREQQRPENDAVQADAAPEIETAANTSAGMAAIQPLPRLRYQSEAKQLQAPENQALEAESAPELALAADAGIDISQLQRTAPLRYWHEESSISEPQKQALAAGPAPQVSGAAAPGLNLEQVQPLPTLRFQMKMPVARGPATKAIEAGQAPALADPLPLGDDGASAATIAAAQANAALGGAQPVSGGSGNGQGSRGGASNAEGAGGGAPEDADIAGRKLAVVGVNPAKDAEGPVPFGRRRGRFSAAPNGEPGDGGITGRPGGEASVRIPNLSISGSESSRTASVAAFAARPDSGNAARRFDRDAFLAEIGDRSLTELPFDNRLEPRPENPEAGLIGRRIHTLAINMPNISSAQGSWIVRFAEVPGSKRQGELFAPAPHVKVDPKYAQSAREEGIEGEVILSGVIRSDGAVDHIKLIKSLDERLDEAAIAALSKWKFRPALKGGVPVDVEVVVRIPFRLTPLFDDSR